MTPIRGSEFSAGLDLFAAEAKVIATKGRALVKTDLQVALPDGCYGRIAPRSGLAYKKVKFPLMKIWEQKWSLWPIRKFFKISFQGIDVGAGVIDQDYRGNVGIILFNFGDEDFKVEKGDRIAQFILEKIFIPTLVESSEKVRF